MKELLEFFRFRKQLKQHDKQINQVTKKRNYPMTIMIKDSVGIDEKSVLLLAMSLLENRPPKENSFDYGFESHGAIGLTINYSLPFPIQVWQTNKRKSAKDRIAITIERHYPL